MIQQLALQAVVCMAQFRDKRKLLPGGSFSFDGFARRKELFSTNDSLVKTITNVHFHRSAFSFGSRVRSFCRALYWGSAGSAVFEFKVDFSLHTFSH